MEVYGRKLLLWNAVSARSVSGATVYGRNLRFGDAYLAALSYNVGIGTTGQRNNCVGIWERYGDFQIQNANNAFDFDYVNTGRIDRLILTLGSWGKSNILKRRVDDGAGYKLDVNGTLSAVCHELLGSHPQPSSLLVENTSAADTGVIQQHSNSAEGAVTGQGRWIFERTGGYGIGNFILQPEALDATDLLPMRGLR